MANAIEKMALALDNVIFSWQQVLSYTVTKESVWADAAKPLMDDFRRFSNGSFASKIDYGLIWPVKFFIWSKWKMYKTVYRFEESFFNALVDTEDTVFHSESLLTLPVTSFFVSYPDPKFLGFFVTIEKSSRGANFYISHITKEISPYRVVTQESTLELIDGLTITESINAMYQAMDEEVFTDLASEGHSVRDFTPDENIDFTIRAMIAASQVALYLSAQNSIVKKVRIPESKRPRRANGLPLKLHEWDVGYRIGCVYNKPIQKKKEADAGPTDEREFANPGSSKRPHMRRAHWHHYRKGKGRTELVLKWIEPMWVGGMPDALVATEHRVLAPDENTIPTPK